MPLQSMELVVPADVEYALAVGLAVDGMGMKAGLSMDLLADLRILCAECLDLLSNQTPAPDRVRITAEIKDSRLHLTFCAATGEKRPCFRRACNLEITQGILETIMPDVAIDTGPNGVQLIRCSMPV